MKILVVGGGGREHALAWKLQQSPKVEKIFIAPGNAGTALVGENIRASTTEEVLAWLHTNPVDLVVIGPERYLADGLVDKVKGLGTMVFGPTRAAAEIEWSKSYAKQLMIEEGVPTAAYKTFTKADAAKTYLTAQTFPVVIKAEGLAAGKGVVIAHNLTEAVGAIDAMLGEQVFGSAGNLVVIEEYLEGLEVSVHAFCDGENVALFPVSQDHKRIYDGDKGPNTGGMGAVAPVSLVRAEQLDEIKEKIILPTLAALKKRNRIFQGVLYPGIMLTQEGPKVIEFNTRFGEPEAQLYMMLLETDLVDILVACAQGALPTVHVEWAKKFATCVVLASEGYPGSPQVGKEVAGLESVSGDIVVFHAGTNLVGEKVITSGGRVLGVTATGATLKESIDRAYNGLKPIHFDGMHYRKDIGASLL
jgi:phosphoribosylamine--glycine ligase